jgi:hypothetical protein
MRKISGNRGILLAGLTAIMLGILACSTSAFPPPQPPVAPAATSVQVVEESISQSVTLATNPLSEESQSPVYTITAQTPFLDGSTDPRVQAFNTKLKDLIQKEIDAFKKDVQQAISDPAFPGGSSFDVRYELIGQRGDLWSIKFNIEGYMAGAAHPYHYSIPVNYDLGNGRDVTLDEVFLPNSGYLQFLSQYSAAQLGKRDIGFDGFQQGADPAPENYRIWNVSPDGLVITFDEYQVAPYAAGPQTMTIPFSELITLLNRDGPVKPFLN